MEPNNNMATAFHNAFTEITSECEGKGFRLPNSTDFGFGWRKAQEFYAAQLAAEKARVAELEKALRHYADRLNWSRKPGVKRGEGKRIVYDPVDDAEYEYGGSIAQAALAQEDNDER